MPKDTINHVVGRQLRRQRLRLGMSQGDLAKQIGVAAQQVQKYEAGTNVMNVIRLHQFADILKVPVNYFFETAGTSVKRGKGKPLTASDREALEVAKSFHRIGDHGLRKRLADLTRLIAIKTEAD